jgi:hypothetical protein
MTRITGNTISILCQDDVHTTISNKVSQSIETRTVQIPYPRILLRSHTHAAGNTLSKPQAADGESTPYSPAPLWIPGNIGQPSCRPLHILAQLPPDMGPRLIVVAVAPAEHLRYHAAFRVALLFTEPVAGDERAVVSQSLSSSIKFRGWGTRSRMVVDSPDVGLPLSFSKECLLITFPRLLCSFIRVRSLLRAKGTHHAPSGSKEIAVK